MNNNKKYIVRFKEEGKKVDIHFTHLRGEKGARAFGRERKREGTFIHLKNTNGTKLPL